MDLLEESNLFLQGLNASLQVQPGQCGAINILDTNTNKKTKILQQPATKCAARTETEREPWLMRIKGKAFLA